MMLNVLSCRVTYSTFGMKEFPKQNDTLELQQKIALIRNIPNSLFESGIFIGQQHDSIRYRLFKPRTAQTAAKRYPLILVLHGSGAIGTDNEKQLGVLAKLWLQEDIKTKYPAYILSPQFPNRSSNYEKDNARAVLASKPKACLQTVLQLLDSIEQTHFIDTNRIYVIGFSMGGSTVINAMIARPQLFAAGINISGIPQFQGMESIRKMPIWLIHGNSDSENPIHSDDQFYHEIKNKKKFRYWIFKNTEHNNIMCFKLLGNTIPEWLFKQVRK